MPRAKVGGTTAVGRKRRELDIWIDDDPRNPRKLHLWIHAPHASPNDGWEIVVQLDEFVAALREIHLDPQPPSS